MKNKRIILLLFSLVILLVISSLVIYKSRINSISNLTVKYYNGEKYYISNDIYKGEYDYQSSDDLVKSKD